MASARRTSTLEQAVLGGGERHRLAGDGDGVRHLVDDDAAVLQRVAQVTGAAAPADGAQPRQQLVEGERLHEEVVGAAVEAGDAIGDGVAGGDDDHRRVDAAGAQPPAHLEAVEAGQHQVEHDGVVFLGRRHLHRRHTVLDQVHQMAFLGQAADDEAADLGIVFDDEHAHGGGRQAEASATA